MSIPPEPVVEAASYFKAHDERQRIHKLLFYLCKKYWENDPNVIDRQSIEDLVIELVQLKPNIDQLSSSLSRLVNTLNCPEVYTAIAQTIVNQLEPIYIAPPNTSTSTARDVVDGSPPAQSDGCLKVQCPDGKRIGSEVITSTTESQYLAEQISHTLSQHPEQARIKKLIFAVTQGYWENNSRVIDAAELPQLLLALRQRYASQKELYIGFGQVVNSINKATQYVAIAKLVIQQITGLYENSEETRQSDTSELLSSQPTLIANPAPASAMAKQKADQRPSQSRDNDTGPNTLSPASSHIDPVNPAGVVPGADALPSQSVAKYHQSNAYNPFDLRTEIMQYVIPLRAKILLFSVLFQSDEDDQDWGMIRRYGLDDLVDQFLQSCQNPNDVDSQIKSSSPKNGKPGRLSADSPDVNQNFKIPIVTRILVLYLNRQALLGSCEFILSAI